MARIFERSPRSWWFLAAVCGVWIATMALFNVSMLLVPLVLLILLPVWIMFPLLVVAALVACRRPRPASSARDSDGRRNARPWSRPQRWLALAATCLVGLLYSWLSGAFVGGLEVDETCQFQHRQHFDDAFWDAHHHEWSTWFPLHRMCNADYDLVPFWVNPALVILGLGAIGCLVTAALLIRPRFHGRQR